MDSLQDYPDSLKVLLDLLQREIARLTSRLEFKEIDVEEWQRTMEALIARYSAAAYMTGAGTDELSTLARESLVMHTQAQLGFLDNFAVTIASEPEFMKGWQARAESYAKTIVVPYWQGQTRLLPLPAMPAEGTQCLNNCKCKWEIIPVDESAGDFDCYWRLMPAEHCQTCTERARTWNPIRIRGGRIQLKERIKLSLVTHKHLPGKHDQASHGNWARHVTEISADASITREDRDAIIESLNRHKIPAAVVKDIHWTGQAPAGYTLNNSGHWESNYSDHTWISGSNYGYWIHLSPSVLADIKNQKEPIAQRIGDRTVIHELAHVVYNAKIYGTPFEQKIIDAWQRIRKAIGIEETGHQGEAASQAGYRAASWKNEMEFHADTLEGFYMHSPKFRKAEIDFLNKYGADPEWFTGGLPIRVKELRLKHYPGHGHDQKRHGWRYGSTNQLQDSMRRIRKRNQAIGLPDRVETEIEELKRRARIRRGVHPALAALHRIRDVEAQISKLDHEAAYAFDAEGRELFHVDGKKHEVEFTDHQLQQIRRNGQAVMTHNHPGEQIYPGNVVDTRHSENLPFSQMDLNAAAKMNLAEIRVTGPGQYTYSMTRPKDGYWPDPYMLNGEYESAKYRHFPTYYSMLHTQKIPEVSAEIYLRIQVWKDVAQRFGLDFNVETGPSKSNTVGSYMNVPVTGNEPLTLKHYPGHHNQESHGHRHVDRGQFQYEEYSDWSRVLARNYTRRELEKQLEQVRGEIPGAANSHERAIKRTYSMESNSQHRAQSGNLIAHLGEKRMALESALELYDYYPEFTKEYAEPGGGVQLRLFKAIRDLIALKHLAGQHDQKLHGSWAHSRAGEYKLPAHIPEEDRKRLETIGYTEADNFGAAGVDAAGYWLQPHVAIVFPDGKTLYSRKDILYGGPVDWARHTTLYSGYILAHPEEFQGDTIPQMPEEFKSWQGLIKPDPAVEVARRLLDNDILEHGPTEKMVMDKTGAISLDTGYNSLTNKAVMGVKGAESFQPASAAAASGLLRSVKHLLNKYPPETWQKGLPDFDQLDLHLPQFYNLIDRSALDQISGFRRTRNDYGDEVFDPVFKEIRYKHLAGRHDQKRHGWRYGSSNRLQDTMRRIRRQAGDGSTRISLIRELEEFKRRARLKRGATPAQATYQRVRDTEMKIRNLPIEMGFVFDQEGKELSRAMGDRHKVEFGVIKESEFLDKDAIFTHNHPGAWNEKGEGSPFSDADIYFAIRMNVSELRAVTPNGNAYIMRRPEKGWPDRYDAMVAFNNLYSKHYRTELDILRNAHDARWYQPARETYEKIWRDFAQEIGATFIKQHYKSTIVPEAPRPAAVSGSQAFLQLKAITLKHLPGKHDQKRHGWRYGSTNQLQDTMRRIRDRHTRLGLEVMPETEEFKRRARIRMGVDPRKATYHRIRDTEMQIRNLRYEVGHVFTQDGREMFSQKGDAHEIHHSEEELNAIMANGNAIYTHNHPEANPLGYSRPLSNQDVLFASTYNLAEIRSVNGNGSVYIMRRPKNGWKKQGINDFLDTWDQLHDRHYPRFLQRIREEGMPEFNASIEMRDAMLKDYAQMIGADYQMIQYRSTVQPPLPKKITGYQEAML